MFERLGVAITVLGVCSADSDNLLVPLVLLVVGLMTAWIGGNREQSKRR